MIVGLSSISKLHRGGGRLQPAKMHIMAHNSYSSKKIVEAMPDFKFPPNVVFSAVPSRQLVNFDDEEELNSWIWRSCRTARNHVSK